MPTNLMLPPQPDVALRTLSAPGPLMHLHSSNLSSFAQPISPLPLAPLRFAFQAESQLRDVEEQMAACSLELHVHALSGSSLAELQAQLRQVQREVSSSCSNGNLALLKLSSK